MSVSSSRACRAAIALFSALVILPSAARSAEVNLYTHRETALIKPILDRFTEASGIKVNVIFAQSGLAERIQAEGPRSPADMLLSVDIATLTHAIGLGITQPVTSPVLEAAIPSHLRGKDGGWHAVSLRARAILVSKERVKDTTLTYEDLAAPRFKGRLCIRDGLHPYNTSLIAAAIARMGEAKAEAWLTGMRANLARKPSGGDRDVAKDIAAGLCDIGVSNTYYIGLMEKDPNQRAWAEAVRVILPRFENGGTHVNISGFVIAKHARNRNEALKLAEWLVSRDAQALYASHNYEYPVVANVPVDALNARYGTLMADTLPLEQLGALRKAASELVDKIGFNLGPSP